MNITDTYQTIANPSEEILFKDRGSKFFGYAFPIQDEEEVKKWLTQVKNDHHTARHWCYAWQIGIDPVRYRVNDDGEPSNSAGQPIYGQIQSFEITDVLIIVVRYFGGVKLGVGGLINAYRSAAKLALESSTIIKKTIDQKFKLTFEYKDVNQVMRIIKEHQLYILSQKMELNCEITISIKKSLAHKIKPLFSPLYEVRVELA